MLENKKEAGPVAYVEIVRQSHVYKATVRDPHTLAKYCSRIRTAFWFGAVELRHPYDQLFTKRLADTLNQIRKFSKFGKKESL